MPSSAISPRPIPARLGSAGLGLARVGSVWFGLARFGSAQFGWARFDSAQLVNLDFARRLRRVASAVSDVPIYIYIYIYIYGKGS